MFNPIKRSLEKMVLAQLMKKNAVMGEPGQTTSMEGVLPSPTGGAPLMSFSVGMVTSDDGKRTNIRIGVTAPALTMMKRETGAEQKDELQGVKRLMGKATSIVKRTTGTLARRGSYTSLLQLELFAPEEQPVSKRLERRSKKEEVLEPAKDEPEQLMLPMMSTPKVAFFYSEE